MTDEEKINALMENLAKQWVEDKLKKPSITTLYQYNMLISQTNALVAAEYFSEDFTGQIAWDFVNNWAAIYGSAALSALVGADEDDWVAGFPVPAAV